MYCIYIWTLLRAQPSYALDEPGVARLTSSNRRRNVWLADLTTLLTLVSSTSKVHLQRSVELRLEGAKWAGQVRARCS